MPIFEKKYISYQLPIFYRTPKTRANYAAADVLLQKHELHNQKCSGDRYGDFVKHEKMLIFSKKICFASVP